MRSSTAVTAQYLRQPLAPFSIAVPPRAILRIGLDGWLTRPAGARGDEADTEDDHALLHGEVVSVLIFRLGEEWLAFRIQAIAEVTWPDPYIGFPTARTRS